MARLSSMVTASDLKRVNFDDPWSTPPPKTDYKEPTGFTYSVPILPTFSDRTRPYFDTTGRALDGLKSIRLTIGPVPSPTMPLCCRPATTSAKATMSRRITCSTFAQGISQDPAP